MKVRIRTQLLHVIAFAAVGFAPVYGFAHGKLESAVPAAGSSVNSAPQTLRLTFNEDLEGAFSTVKVADSTGVIVSQEKGRVDPANPRVLTLAVPKVTPGAYEVRWAVMTLDGHKANGTYAFQVK